MNMNERVEKLALVIEHFMVAVPGDCDNEREWSSEEMAQAIYNALPTLGAVWPEDVSREGLACFLCDLGNPDHAEGCGIATPKEDTCSWLFDADKVITYLKERRIEEEK